MVDSFAPFYLFHFRHCATRKLKQSQCAHIAANQSLRGNYAARVPHARTQSRHMDPHSFAALWNAATCKPHPSAELCRFRLRCKARDAPILTAWRWLKGYPAASAGELGWDTCQHGSFSWRAASISTHKQLLGFNSYVQTSA